MIFGTNTSSILGGVTMISVIISITLLGGSGSGSGCGSGSGVGIGDHQPHHPNVGVHDELLELLDEGGVISQKLFDVLCVSHTRSILNISCIPLVVVHAVDHVLAILGLYQDGIVYVTWYVQFGNVGM